jgi:hypothetical protein
MMVISFVGYWLAGFEFFAVLLDEDTLQPARLLLILVVIILPIAVTLDTDKATSDVLTAKLMQAAAADELQQTFEKLELVHDRAGLTIAGRVVDHSRLSSLLLSIATASTTVIAICLALRASCTLPVSHFTEPVPCGGVTATQESALRDVLCRWLDASRTFKIYYRCSVCHINISLPRFFCFSPLMHSFIWKHVRQVGMAAGRDDPGCALYSSTRRVLCPQQLAACRSQPAPLAFRRRGGGDSNARIGPARRIV